MSKATVTTFAKLNLVLNVFQPEIPGGLHPIASIFQTVSLSDQLLITHTQTPGLVLETDHPDLQNPAENLLAKMMFIILKNILTAILIIMFLLVLNLMTLNKMTRLKPK